MANLKKYIGIGATALLSTFLYTQCALAFPNRGHTIPGQNLEQKLEKRGPIINEPSPIEIEKYRGASLIQQVLNLMQDDYKKEKLTVEDYRNFFNGAAKGALQSLDRYSSFHTPEEYLQFEISSGEDYKGIGTQLRKLGGGAVALIPYKHSPAEKRGIEKGDILVGIDDYDVKYSDRLEDLVLKILGPNDKVKLRVIREGVEGVLEYEITKEFFAIPTIESTNYDDGILYIQIASFGENTHKDFDRELSSTYDGLIIDLRKNGGGRLDTVLKMLDEFLPKGKLLLMVEGRGMVEEIYSRTSEEMDKPTVVIMDKYTGSASEIMAGVLQDYDKAELLGETSFGKGTVQHVIPLFLDPNDNPHDWKNDADGFARLTIAEYVLPSGRHIDGVGVTPDVEVKKGDPLKKALEYIRLKLGIPLKPPIP